MPTSNKKLFNSLTPEDHAYLLASHLPPGRLLSGAFDDATDLGKLIKGLAFEYYLIAVLIDEIANKELDINQTDSLIEDWEKSVKIPNDYFSRNTSLENRRLQVLQLFTNFGGVQKAEDFERVATVFGYNVTVSPGGARGLFPIPFPLSFYADVREATHTLLVEFVDAPTEDFFPLDFPLDFFSGAQDFLQRIFEALAPANVRVLFV